MGFTKIMGRFYISTFSLLLLLNPGIRAQSWQITYPAAIATAGPRDIIPQRYITYQLDPDEIKQVLWQAPKENFTPATESNVLLTVGLADGTADIFRIVEYEMMEPGLSQSYPDIRTFRGISVSNPYRRLRADWTVNGFRAVIRDLEGTMYIDPFQRNDPSHCISYYTRDFHREGIWTCDSDDVTKVGAGHQQERAGDCMFRSYRLAVAATGEYSNYFGATSSSQSGLVLAEVVTAVNRLNEVYELDFAIRLILVANNTSIFFYNSGSDPYSGDACTQRIQNTTVINNAIGSGNYDIGHVFSVGSGGCATLGCVCTSNKANGATGLNPPTGDPFYIDYVAHEVGHQFGGSHTFNGTTGSCAGGNRSASSAYEPGSGSTIMAYAGICGDQDLQPNSDDYFHARSLFQVASHAANTTCEAFIAFNNDPPVAANVPNYTIPISTPFVLTASVNDPDDDPLTYCWEQYDLESTATEPPTSNDTDGPLFRSFDPVTIPQRYFPRLQDLIQNVSPMWEVLPSVGRTMNYRMTVRDYHDVAGCTDEDDVTVTTVATAGPFTVTSQNSATLWLDGSEQTITWAVANTTASPVNCANVDIKLSYDGGITYPVTLLSNTPNDGSATVTLPAGTTTEGRVMVKASNNIFFDINNQDISIEAGLPNYLLSLNPNPVNECNDGSVQTMVNVESINGFSDLVSLAVVNPPPGAIINFVPQVVVPGNASVLTISGISGLFGSYSPTVRGSSTTGIRTLY